MPVGLGLALLLTGAALGAPAAMPTATGKVDFGRDIQPLFNARCVACHGAQKQDGGLRLDVRRRAMLGGDSGPVIVPRSAKSELLHRLTTSDLTHRMPVGGRPLTPAEVGIIRAWIEQGAPWPDALAGQETYGSHWSFKPIRRPAVPVVREAQRVRNPIDAFVLARLEKKGLTLSSEAEPRTLIRRLHLDLTGLPPTPEEIARFVKECEAEGRVEREGWSGEGSEREAVSPQGATRAKRVPSPAKPHTPRAKRGTRPEPSEAHAHPQGAHSHPISAYERLVDRLLASPHFGERWGRHWLDLARFAESDGYENDRIRSEAWRFRDWVIEAVNRDLPFDQFTVEQLAGDLLPNATPTQKIAAGFHRNTLWNSAASADKEEFRTYAIKDRTDTTGTVWMGLTLGCAKCHTHKYDPVTQREYYQLYGFFNATDNDDFQFPGGQAQTLKAVARETYVHLRGNFLQKGETVAPGTPAFLPALKPRGTQPDRLDLARWLVSGQHPLTARVAVNHVWQGLFGQGLVPTPDNYGLSGKAPVYGDLLDYLAAAFSSPASHTTPSTATGEWRGESGGRRVGTLVDTAASGPKGSTTSTPPPLHTPTPGLNWSRKALIRLIVTSAVYRQRSTQQPELLERDPENTLLARQNRFRVEAEIVRDLALSVSGLLDPKLGGPSIQPAFPEGLIEQRFQNEALRLPGGEQHRRGVYIHVQRTLQHPVLAAFDGADGNQACVRRDRSNTPIQALTLLNDPTYLECAKALGARLRKGAVERDERLRLAFRLCLGREPRASELSVLTELVRTQERLGASEEAVWTGVGRALLNLEEFTTRE